MNKFVTGLVLIALGFSFSQAREINEEAKISKQRDKMYNKTIHYFMNSSKRLKKLVNEAYAYAVFPSVGKGSAILGITSGDGRVFQGGRWIGDAEIFQFSIGAQAGGASFKEIIFFKDKEALDKFRAQKLHGAAQFSITPIFKGFSVDADFVEGMMAFTSMNGGLMVDLSIATQSFEYQAR